MSTVKGIVNDVLTVGVIVIGENQYAPGKKYRDNFQKNPQALKKYIGKYVELTLDDNNLISNIEEKAKPKEVTYPKYATMLEEYGEVKPSVYAKLQRVRVILQGMNIKKTGKNVTPKFSFDYFELGDFLPYINILFDEYKLGSYVSFGQELATLTIVNSEKPEEQIVFTSPMGKVELRGGAQEIQQLGASETYSRRYLYMSALEIIEHDSLDAKVGA